MTWTGDLLSHLVAQTPVVAILLVILILDRRDHKATIKAMQEEMGKLQTALIDHLNRTRGE